ncbi:phosphoribosylformylglycinamidine cyclo-ligase [Deltaproteobacteria bacterium OttesenSCG-928-M10]|nr:phosphoribosylformylglycinamidine cyclo-ligase [Deltaproteobacteria bacterium OttesenSCG-928-M10]
MSEDKKPISYRDAGVDIDAGNLAVEKMKEAVRSTYRPEVLGDLGGFGGLFALNAGGYKSPVLVSGTDGVGTKLQIAFMMDRHDTIGRDVVAMCVNDVLAQGAEPLFFLDYLAVGKLSPDQVAEVVRGVADGCRESGCALIGGETAEMAGFYRPGEYDLAGFCVGIVDREKILPRPDEMAPGDVLVALPSSGLHSNGYSLVRKICFDHMKFKVTDHIDELGRALGEELLTPTRLYPEIVLPLLNRFNIKGIVHITGGGFQENLPRALPEGLMVRVDPSSWNIPVIFKLLQKWGNVNPAEMYRTFNMGLGLVMIVAAKEADDFIAALAREGQASKLIGRLEKGPRSAVVDGVTNV